MRLIPKFGLAGFAALGFSITLGLFVDGALFEVDLLPKRSPFPKTPDLVPVQANRTPGERFSDKAGGVATSTGTRTECMSEMAAGVPAGPRPKIPYSDCRSDSPKKDRKIGESRPLKIFSKPRPAYTDAARESGVQGTVILRVTFGANDKVLRASVVKGLPHGLSDRAVEAAMNMKFKAPVRNGRPYTVNKAVHFNFKIY